MIGQTVSRYRILEQIGAGSMGTVYKAQDTILGRFAAVKLLAEKYLNDREMLLRFEREGQAASALLHPNICTVFDAGRSHSRPYIAMELLSGASLSDRIKAGPAGAAELIGVALAVTDALSAAHAIGIVHRDIKPANLFVTTRGQVKVLDFGLAKMRREATTLGDSMATIATFATMPGTLLGTLAYMPPEQVRGEPLDGRADLYSLGIVLHEMATGALPVRDYSRHAVPLPGGLGPIVAKLTALDAAQRFASAAEARDAFARLKVETASLS